MALVARYWEGEEMTQLQQVLKHLRACHDACEWVGERTLAEAWEQSGRGDWMLWFAATIEVDRKLLALAACGCARTALKYVPDGEYRPRLAIEAAEAWCRGEAGIDDVRAAYAGYAAYAAADAADAAYAAAYAAADAAADAADAADAAAYAADAAAYAARAASFAYFANIVRGIIPFVEVERAYSEVVKLMEEK